MSLLIAECIWNSPPNLQWLKAKMRILHLPPKLKDLLLIKKYFKMRAAKVCTLHMTVKFERIKKWKAILVHDSPLKKRYLWTMEKRRVKRCSKMWLFLKIKFCLWFPQCISVCPILTKCPSFQHWQRCMGTSLLITNLKNVSGTEELVP